MIKICFHIACEWRRRWIFLVLLVLPLTETLHASFSAPFRFHGNKYEDKICITLPTSFFPFIHTYLPDPQRKEIQLTHRLSGLPLLSAGCLTLDFLVAVVNTVNIQTHPCKDMDEFCFENAHAKIISYCKRRLKSRLSLSSECVETKLCKLCTSFTLHLHSLCGMMWYRTLRVNISSTR